MTTQHDTFRQIGEEMGTEALALTAAVLQASAASTYAAQNRYEEHLKEEIANARLAFISLYEELVRANIKIDSHRLAFIIDEAGYEARDMQERMDREQETT